MSLENDAISLLVTRSVGPRIISLRAAGGQNLFAELPDLTLPYPGGGVFHFWGGHRLWHAPEVKRRTYVPDDKAVTVEDAPGGLQVSAPPEPETGLQKALRLELTDPGATVVVDHTLTNHGFWPVETAPWAITQLKTGGIAILPQSNAPADPDGVQPNRTLALWPYTNVRSPYVVWGNDVILVRSVMETGNLKIGFPNPRGWLAYYRAGTLFVKRAPFDEDAAYFDGGSSSQCFCNPHFLELETLGPRTQLAPGASISHREVWEVYEGLSLEPANEEPARVLAALLAQVDIDIPFPSNSRD